MFHVSGSKTCNDFYFCMVNLVRCLLVRILSSAIFRKLVRKCWRVVPRRDDGNKCSHFINGGILAAHDARDSSNLSGSRSYALQFKVSGGVILITHSLFASGNNSRAPTGHSGNERHLLSQIAVTSRQKRRPSPRRKAQLSLFEHGCLEVIMGWK